MTKIKRVAPTKKVVTKKEEIEEEVMPDPIEEDIEDISENDFDEDVEENDFDEITEDDIYGEDDNEDSVEDEEEDEEEEEVIVEEPVKTKKVSNNKKSTQSKSTKSSTKKNVTRKSTKSNSDSEESEDTPKKNVTRKSTKPTSKKVSEEKESEDEDIDTTNDFNFNSSNRLSKDVIVKAKKIISERSKNNFNSYVEGGATEVDLSSKNSVNSSEIAKIIINNIYDIINGEDSEMSNRLSACLNLEFLTVPNMKAIMKIIELTQMQCIKNKKKFILCNSHMRISHHNPKVSLAKNLPGLMKEDVYTEAFSEFVLKFPLNEKKNHYGSYDVESKIFTDNDGNEFNIEEDTEAFKKKCRKDFPLNLNNPIMAKMKK